MGFMVIMLPPYHECKSARSTDCVEWCADNGNIICVHIRSREAISVRQVCESHQAREIATSHDIDAVIVRQGLLRSFDTGYWWEIDVTSVSRKRQPHERRMQKYSWEHGWGRRKRSPGSGAMKVKTNRRIAILR